MKLQFSRLFFFGFFLVTFLGTLTPLSVASAGIVPCGTRANPSPCTLCHIVVGGQKLIDWGLDVMTYIAIAVIVAMAVLYIVSTGNEALMSTAKSGIKAALIGFVVMLSAWLIVNTTLNIMVVDETDGAPLSGLRQDGTFTFSCD